MIFGVNSVQATASLNESIFVKVLDGKTLALPFDPASKLCRYYKDIEQREGIPDYYQRLFYAGKQLQGNDTLSDYSIPPGATLHLKLLRVMQIFIYFYNENFFIEVDPEDRIDKVKQRIQDKKGLSLSPNQYDLIFSGKQLKDDRTVASYSIYPEAELCMVLRLSGGGLPFPFVNMEQEKIITFSAEAPEWRIVQPGLNLLGTCINAVCRAYQQSIWIPRGFGTFNMNKECKISLCPICKKVADKVNNLGVYSCFFSIKGSFKDGNNKQISYEKQRTRAPDDQLLSFNDGEGTVKEWYFLNIITENLPMEMQEIPNHQAKEIDDANQTEDSGLDDCNLLKRELQSSIEDDEELEHEIQKLRTDIKSLDLSIFEAYETINQQEKGASQTLNTEVDESALLNPELAEPMFSDLFFWKARQLINHCSRFKFTQTFHMPFMFKSQENLASIWSDGNDIGK